MSLLIWGLALTLSGFVSCRKNNIETKDSSPVDLNEIIERDTLVVGTLYGATSYFLYRDEYMGYDYELALALTADLKLKLKIVTAVSVIELAHLLQDRKIDIIATNVYQTPEFKSLFRFVMPQQSSHQVLVQRLSINSISEISELKGKTVHVKPNTVYRQRLENLHNETGGVFTIVDAPDTLSSEELIEQVANGKIEMTLAHNKTAQLYKLYHKNLDIRMPVGYDQQNGWMIRNESKALAQKIEEWKKSSESELIITKLYQKYWKKSPYFAQKRIKIPRGAVSPYDDLFKKYASEINWDWKLLAAVAFHESRFDSSQVSWAGAAGLMQLMPRTAANFGLSREQIMNPEKNIEAGVQYIKSLNLSFRKIEDTEERLKFILGAYNSGPAHIFDAMALTRKYGKNPHIWFNNVEYYVLKKSEPEYFNDPVVKYGRFKGKETVAYVKNTLDTYYKYTGK
ncbi:MAG: transporter substrate-binding domain-containing protein [Paludibacteraceae bacterium]|nr:transporter substrate-binding domain-containing protein [Paludibacteraceae bacterium]